jgi:predicted nucleic acid-binding protein
MKAQRIYVDTSVIGGCHDEEFEPWSRGLMDDFRGSVFRPVVSKIVTLEIQEAPAPVQQTYAELLRLDPDVLEVSDEEALLAGQYLERGILSENYYDDAQHIALATVANVDVLASWNFRHIVHFDKVRRFNAVNPEQGYKSVDIRSPREITHH